MSFGTRDVRGAGGLVGGGSEMRYKLFLVVILRCVPTYSVAVR